MKVSYAEKLKKVRYLIELEESGGLRQVAKSFATDRYHDPFSEGIISDMRKPKTTDGEIEDLRDDVTVTDASSNEEEEEEEEGRKESRMDSLRKLEAAFVRKIDRITSLWEFPYSVLEECWSDRPEVEFAKMMSELLAIDDSADIGIIKSFYEMKKDMFVLVRCSIFSNSANFACPYVSFNLRNIFCRRPLCGSVSSVDVVNSASFKGAWLCNECNQPFDNDEIEVRSN